MTLRFGKYEGIGNDFLVVDVASETALGPQQARKLCDRHYGVGGDGVLLSAPPVTPGAHGRMVVLNSDGSRPEGCGNGLRCVALSLARTQSRAQQLAERMSESYRRSELRFRNAMRFSAIGKALLGREGRIVDVNLALANILHSSPEELVGRPLMSYFVEVGRGNVPASDIRTRLHARGEPWLPTAPPSGLFLEAVVYERERFARPLLPIVPVETRT